MHYKLVIYKLRGCTFCERVIDLLKKENYIFSEKDVYDPGNTEMSDRLDNLFGTQRYPKLLLTLKTNTVFIIPSGGNNIHEILKTDIFERFDLVEDVLHILKKYIK